MRNAWLQVFIIAALPLGGQTGGEISGIVHDSAQTPAPGVRITVVNESIRAEAITYTDARGSYRIAGLLPDNYTLRAFRQGSGEVVKSGLRLSPGGQLRLDLELPPAAAGGWQMPVAGSLTFFLVSALVGALVLLLFTEPARYVLKKFWAIVPWTSDKAFEFLAPRFPDRVGLPGYRKRVARSPVLSRIENPFGPEKLQGRVFLDRAFAPLSVTTGNEQDRVDLFKFSAGNSRFLVLGGPGTGKTTLMKNLVLSVANGRSGGDLNQLIPVFIVLRDMASTGHSVEQAIIAALAGFRFMGSARFVESALKSGRMLIVLDGLDEVGASRETVTTRIREFCITDEQRDENDARRNRLIVTCRENSYRTRDLADVIPTTTRVEPFAPQHMRSFLLGWPTYEGRSALALYPLIQADSQTLDICRNPLMLTILTGLYLAKDRFDIPSSRDDFYRTSIDELLVQRPGRRSTRQEFADTDKWSLLQRIALDRLETVREDEDPELLSGERLFDFAQQVLGASLERTGFQKLLRELVEVNGIIKPVAEGGYVLGHRTFQEYLASREAHRTREVAAVVHNFGRRSELVEALTFYCGLLKNIPQVNTAMKLVLQSGDTIVAGRCLLSVTETPSVDLVEPIIELLVEPVRAERAFRAELEILSSLAQRPGLEFELARRRFAEVIEVVVGSAQGSVSGLVSTLSTRPELAMKLVPALLANPSETWRRAAVTLLHDLGTDDALEELLRLVGSDSFPERAWAAVYIANLIRSRGAELKRGAVLLKERNSNRALWPFENHFPGRIAVPVLEALRSAPVDNLPPLTNACVEAALDRARVGSKSRFDERRWRNVERHLGWNEYRVKTARRLYAATFALAITWTVACLGLNGWCLAKQQMALVTARPVSVTFAPAGPLIALNLAAGEVYAELKRKYPPQPLWWRRFLPSNWEITLGFPDIPEGSRHVAQWLQLQSSVDPGYHRTEPSGTSDVIVDLLGMTPAVRTFRDRLAHLRETLPPTRGGTRFTIVYGGKTKLISSLGLLALVSMLWFYRTRLSQYRLPGTAGRFSSKFIQFWRLPMATMTDVTVAFYVSVMAAGVFPWESPERGALFSAGWFALLILGKTLPIPRNPYMHLVQSLKPISEEEAILGTSRIRSGSARSFAR